MGLNGFTEWLFSALLSWMQIIYNWFWSMLASGGQNEFMPWFSDNWLKLVIILVAVGLAVDYTIYLMRWRPYHVWLTTLRRARGYVSKPFAKEQPHMRYAGYKRVLEGLDDEDVTVEMRITPGSRARERMEVYEGETPGASKEAYRAPASPANVRPPRDAMHGDGYAEDDYAAQDGYAEDDYAAQDGYASDDYAAQDGYASDDYAAQDGYASDDYAAQDGYAADDYAAQDGQAPCVDAEQQYVPESIAQEPPAPDVQEELFAEPPKFARSGGAVMPMYGRVYQGPGQQYMPVQADSRPHFEMPDMDMAALGDEGRESAPIPADERAVCAQAEEYEPADERVVSEPTHEDAGVYGGDLPPMPERAGSQGAAADPSPAAQPEAAARETETQPAAKAQPAPAKAGFDAASANGAYSGTAAQGTRAAAPRGDMPRGYQSRRERAARRREAELAERQRMAQERAEREQAERAERERTAQEQAERGHAAQRPAISVHAVDEQTQWQRPGAQPTPPRSISVRASGDTRDREYDD